MTLEVSLLGLLLAFGDGFISFLSPGVLPLVVGYVAWVAGTDLTTAHAERWRALRLSVFFVLDFRLVFVLLGLGATLIGGLLRRWCYELAVFTGLLIALIGLVQMGLLQLAPLARDLRFRSFGETTSRAVEIGFGTTGFAPLAMFLALSGFVWWLAGRVDTSIGTSPGTGWPP